MTEGTTTFSGEEHATALTSPYWDGLRDGRLMLQGCEECGRAQHYPRVICRFCGSTSLHWHQARGSGTVFAGTRVERVVKPALKDRVPFTIVIVRLAEGPMVMAVLDESRGAARSGDEVEIAFDLTRANRLLTVVSGGSV
jgi:uncharacterized protein